LKKKKKTEKNLEEMVPQKMLKKLGYQDQNFVVYEQIGNDGRIHRNFVTLEKEKEGPKSTTTLLSKTSKTKSSRALNTVNSTSPK
jgi:hypothetical protein